MQMDYVLRIERPVPTHAVDGVEPLIGCLETWVQGRVRPDSGPGARRDAPILSLPAVVIGFAVPGEWGAPIRYGQSATIVMSRDHGIPNSPVARDSNTAAYAVR
jgi:hypothetical protein